MKTMTRRELFKEMVSKDTLKQVVGAWYGFQKPMEDQLQPPKRESLLDKVKTINMKHSKSTITPNGKEG